MRKNLIKKGSFWLAITLILLLSSGQQNFSFSQDMKIKLNAPDLKISLKDALNQRRSCRDFKEQAVELNTLASILWAANGEKFDSVTQATRTVPSAGAIYPLRLYLLTGKGGTDQLKEGLYRYQPKEHSLELISEGDRRAELSDACLSQDFIRIAPLSIIITGNIQLSSNRYRDRARQYVYTEAGHAAQNIYLSVTSFGLATVEVGAFIDDKVKTTLNLRREETPLLVMPIGYPTK
ncbi:MAG: nitroreductase [Candidatus Omnitrophota bacterium]|nr:MAG: nitroreductase [Candidatus Omnitrophota bacterium]